MAATLTLPPSIETSTVPPGGHEVQDRQFGDTCLISDELRIPAEACPSDIVDADFQTQIEQNGFAYYPELVGKLALLARAQTVMRYSFEDDAPFRTLPQLVDEPYWARSTFCHIKNIGDTNHYEPEETGIFVDIASVVMNRLAARGLPKPPQASTYPTLVSQTYESGQGIARHTDTAQQVVHPLYIVALTDGRVTEFITPDGRLVEVEARKGDVLALPQAGSKWADKRVEHAVAPTGEREYSHTLQMVFSDQRVIYGTPEQVASRKNELLDLHKEVTPAHEARIAQSHERLLQRAA